MLCSRQKSLARAGNQAQAFPKPTHFNPEDGGNIFLQNVISAYKTTQCHNPEDKNLNNHSHENFKTYIVFPCVFLNVNHVKNVSNKSCGSYSGLYSMMCNISCLLIKSIKFGFI
jgi:hypothetical protein